MTGWGRVHGLYFKEGFDSLQQKQDFIRPVRLIVCAGQERPRGQDQRTRQRRAQAGVIEGGDGNNRRSGEGLIVSVLGTAGRSEATHTSFSTTCPVTLLSNISGAGCRFSQVSSCSKGGAALCQQNRLDVVHGCCVLSSDGSVAYINST